MLAITKRDKIFSLFALPIAIIALYIFVFGAELHKQNAAYDEHIAQMGTEEELALAQTAANRKLASTKKELEELKNNCSSPAVAAKYAGAQVCTVCGSASCQGEAFCKNSGARISAFRSLLATHNIKLLGSNKVSISHAGVSVEEDGENYQLNGENTPHEFLLRDYSGVQRWNISIEAAYSSLTNFLEDAFDKNYPFVIVSITMTRNPVDNKPKLWTMQIVL